MATVLTTRRRSRWLVELVLVAVIYTAYDSSRLLVRGGYTEAARNATDLLHAEKWVHLDPERWLNTILSAHAWLGVPADFMYATMHYIVTPAVLIWLWRCHRPVYRQARTWLGVSTVTALIGFVTFPTAPPRLLPHSYGYTDTMAEHASVGWWGASASAPKGLGGMTNEFAAMPSLHVGWALWCGLMLLMYARNPIVRILGMLYPVAIALVVMGTGNHYLFDVLAGCLVMGLGALLSRPYMRVWDRFRFGLLARLRSRRTRGPGRPAVPDYVPSELIPQPRAQSEDTTTVL